MKNFVNIFGSKPDRCFSAGGKKKLSSFFVSNLAVYAAVLSVIQCEFTTLSTTLPLETSPHGDFIHFDWAPDTVTVNSSAQVRYTCTKACRIGIEIVLSTPKTVGAVTFRRTWAHTKRFEKTRTRIIPITFPPAVIYKRNFFLRKLVETRDVMLRAWLVHLNEEESRSGHVRVSQYDQSLVRAFKPLQTILPTERPLQLPCRSVAWGPELIWNLTKDRLGQCYLESDVVDLLKFPFASTSEKYGVTRTFRPFANRDLETVRLWGTREPRMALSVWVYLLKWCNKKLCGIIKHVNEDRKYESPLIMLNNNGKIMVQVSLLSRMEQAFTVHTVLPLRTWIRLDLLFYSSQAKIQITQATPKGDTLKATHSFQNAVLYNDTSGYFAIGGDIYNPGIHGYFGPVRFYRLGSEKVVNPLSQVRFAKELDEAQRRCEEIKKITKSYINTVQVKGANDHCESYYKVLKKTFEPKNCKQLWSWNQQKKYSTTLKILKSHEKELLSHIGPRSSMKKIFKYLFQDSVRRLAQLANFGVQEVDSFVIEQLQLCSCWGQQQATLMLATLHLAGLGVPVDQDKGHMYSLMGGAADDHLALLHLGYKHMQGLDGFPKDQDMAYGYYSNVGQQTSIDLDKIDDTQQTVNEYVDLTSKEDMLLQDGESGDVIQFLKHQAERGDISSQKFLAQMLFWGTNGMERDISAAMKWYAKSALAMTDASAMYNYGIFLLKGVGVKKNVTLGIALLEKAADMGSVNALNGLGWYYSTIGNDWKAFHYFEMAIGNGSRDAAFNIGVFHLSGALVDSHIKNETSAFQFFLKAGEMGHVDGAVEAASYLSRGNLQGVTRDSEKAVHLLKPVSERNSHLGFSNRDALKAYQQGSWDEALLKYAIVAETGLVVAQTNAAYLCELLEHDACLWRYFNFSTHNHAPHEAGLLRMGDYYSAKGDMVKATDLYSRAAMQGSPEGMYNLAVLIEDGHNIPTNVLEKLQISTEAQLDERTVVEELFLRCKNLVGEASEVSPCSLALLRLHVAKAWNNFTHSTIQLALIVMTLIIVLIILIRSAFAYYTDCSGSIAVQSQGRQHESSVPDPAVHQEGPQVPSRLELNTQTFATRHVQPLQDAVDLVITATGVCVCALCTIFVTYLF